MAIASRCIGPQVLCVQDGMALLGQSELEVCYFLVDADDYIPVKCSIHPDAITGSLLVFVVSSFACSRCTNICSFTLMLEFARTFACYVYT